MFFENDIQRVMDMFDLHRLLPEHYPEFFRVFLAIAQGPQNQMDFVDIQTRVLLPQTTASRICYILEEHGLISIGLAPGDKRRKRAALTPAGRRTLGEVMRRGWDIASRMVREHCDITKVRQPEGHLE